MAPLDASLALGLGIRHLRLAAGRTMDDLASAAGVLGFRWARSTVANLEAGNRRLSVEEFLGLPLIMQKVSGQPISLKTLLKAASDAAAPDGVRLSAVMTASRLEHYVDDEPIRLAPGMTSAASELLGYPSPQKPAFEEAESLDATWQRAWERVTTNDRRLASRVGVNPALFVIASHRQWSRSFAEERDQRAGEHNARGTRQAQRGHASRQMLDELAPLWGDLAEEFRLQTVEREHDE